MLGAAELDVVPCVVSPCTEGDFDHNEKAAGSPGVLRKLMQTPCYDKLRDFTGFMPVPFL